MTFWLMGTAITVCAGLLGVALFYAGLREWPATYFLSSYGSLPPGDYPRILALFANANMLCNYLTVSFMIAAAMHAAGWLRTPVFAALALGIALTAAFSLSPGLGGLALCAALWAWVRLRAASRLWPARFALAAGVAVAAGFLALTTISPVSQGMPITPAQPLSGVQVEPSSRVLAWQTAFETVRQHPLAGLGLGLKVSEVHYLTRPAAWNI